MNDSDFSKQRTSLILISLAIILFIHGDGKIGDKGGVLGGSIIFGNPDVLIYAGLSIYLWLVWRYTISSKAPLRLFLNHLKLNIYRHENYIDLVRKLGSIKDSVVGVNTQTEDLIKSSALYNPKGDGKLPPIIDKLWWPTNYFYNKSNHVLSSIQLDNNDYISDVRLFPYPETNSVYIKAPFWNILKLEIKVFFRLVLTDKPFSDIIFPFLIAIYAGGLVIAQYFSIG
ncbi:MAG: hypothetical protein HWE27_14265 [Gammaproteobacteria bacterium]|nr:hypothetical protein [Gammaproteobacteria bacterium]